MVIGLYKNMYKKKVLGLTTQGEAHFKNVFAWSIQKELIKNFWMEKTLEKVLKSHKNDLFSIKWKIIKR